VGKEQQNRFWLRGGFPWALLAAADPTAGRCLDGFATTFLERDINQLCLRVPAEALRWYWIRQCLLPWRLAVGRSKRGLSGRGTLSPAGAGHGDAAYRSARYSVENPNFGCEKE